jgi:hypothetical protein
MVTYPDPSSIDTRRNFGPDAQLIELKDGVPKTVPAPITLVKRPKAFVFTAVWISAYSTVPLELPVRISNFTARETEELIGAPELLRAIA